MDEEERGKQHYFFQKLLNVRMHLDECPGLPGWLKISINGIWKRQKGKGKESGERPSLWSLLENDKGCFSEPLERSAQTLQVYLLQITIGFHFISFIQHTFGEDQVGYKQRKSSRQVRECKYSHQEAAVKEHLIHSWLKHTVERGRTRGDRVTYQVETRSWKEEIAKVHPLLAELTFPTSLSLSHMSACLWQFARSALIQCCKAVWLYKPIKRGGLGQKCGHPPPHPTPQQMCAL